jgi:N-acetyl sugar amidotransferase
MPLTGKICTKGVWDESVPGISFDAKGASNYSRIFERMLHDFPRGEKGLEDWKQLVTEIKRRRGKRKYDCLIGVSGGTDSSYLLHVCKEYGLNPLAVYLDNGWASNVSLENIEKMTRALNVDLQTFVIDYTEVKAVLRAYLKAGLPWADGPTDLAIKALLYKKAAKLNLKHVLVGHDFRSEGFQPNEWTYSDAKQLRYLTRRFEGRRLKKYPTLSIWEFGFLSFVRGIKLVRPFFYLEYNKEDAKKFLSAKYGWKDYGGHHHENVFTKFIITYWLYEKFGIDKRKITLSGQVMSGHVSRESAMEAISRKPYEDRQLADDLAYVLKKLEVTEETFRKWFISPNHLFSDYPSYYPLYERFRKTIFGAMKHFLPNKPLMFYQMEERK